MKDEIANLQCSICHRTNLKLVSGVLEEHSNNEPGCPFCKGSGTDCYAREEGEEEGKSVAVILATELVKLRTALTTERSRSCALREALEKAAPFTLVGVTRGPIVQGWEELQTQIRQALADITKGKI